MIERLRLRNFKCFNCEEFIFNNLTILAGANASGKSSVIQALLYYAHSIAHQKENIDIRDVFELDLGVAKSLLSHNQTGTDIEIEAFFENKSSIVRLKPSEESPYSMRCERSAVQSEKFEFRYLKAERIGSRTSTSVSGSIDNIGYSGEFAPSVIENAEKNGISVHEKFATNTGSRKFPSAVEAWMRAIVGNMTIEIKIDYQTGNTDTKFKNDITDFGVVPTLTGFGISYVMPIVVAGLLCSTRDNSILIVENPEAHLHPKAQSQIGKFLALVAECGVQVIIETHSEHIIDGARIQLKKDNETDKMTINFFSSMKKKIEAETICLSQNGELEHWPTGFFDQKRNDLRALLSK